MPAVTVVMATYNWSSVLPYSIASVLGQTMTDFELLVVGDGCTDDSEAVVGRIADSRVRWINLPANTGHQEGPNNEGIRQARGQIIAYLGHDDLWLPQHLGVMHHAITEGADLVHGVTAIVRPGVETPEPAPLEPGLNWVPPSNVLHRRAFAEKVGGWRDYRTLRESPETDLYRRIVAAGGKLTRVERLTTVKFPAAWRPDAYKLRRFDEQATWLERTQTEPDLEQRLLVRMLMARQEPLQQRSAFRQAWIWGGAVKNSIMQRRGHLIDANRKVKGLPPNPRT